MSNNILGIHHVTAISGNAQENVDFYTGVLGSGGRCRTSVGGGNRGGFRLGGGARGLWGFDGGRVAGGRCVVFWIARIWPGATPAGWICDDFAVAPAGLAGRTGGSGRSGEARGGLEPSGAVAGGKGRHRARFSKW